MPTLLRGFGTGNAAPLTVTLHAADDAESIPLVFPRSLWFDRDFDGSWLVWVSTPTDDDLGTATGALAVRDPATSAFLEELAHLLATPEQFADEPVFRAGQLSSG